MTDLEAFEAEVRAHIKQAASPNAHTRLEAVRWLGESGDPQAITALVQAYHSDTNAQVREEARYSLGMFRKLDDELNSKNVDKVMELLEAVAIHGKMGRRLRFPQKTVTKIALGLLLSALLLAVLAFVLPMILNGGSSTVSAPSVPERDRTTLLNDTRNWLVLVNSNASKLQGQYQGALANTALDCSLFFDALTPLTMSDANARDYADVAGVVQQVNQAAADINEAKALGFDPVCATGAILAPADFAAPMQKLVSALQLLPAADQSLKLIESAAGIAATPTPEAGALDASASSAGANAVQIRDEANKMLTIITQVTGEGGAWTSLNQNWADVAAGNTSNACATPFDLNSIPSYMLPAAIEQSEATLKQAADLLNGALTATRRSWQAFNAGCSTNTLASNSAAGLEQAQAAKAAFDLAAQQLALTLNG